jgi:hypothetical protein
MQLWLFFTIFGCVLFIPSIILILLYNRFKNTIVVLDKNKGQLRKIIINDEILASGKITSYKGKRIKPIFISEKEIYFGTWRRWIIKGELESKKGDLTDKEVEDYLNNEDLLKLYLAGKFKDTLIIFLSLILFGVIVGAVVNGYLTMSHTSQFIPTNQTDIYFTNLFRNALLSMSG